jgi:hypothetical protein
MASQLERLVAEQVSQSVVGTIRHMTDAVVEGMVREMLRDKGRRQLFERLIDQALQGALARLNEAAQEGTK